MNRVNFTIAELHENRLRYSSEVTGLAMSDIVRRMVEYCTQPNVFNEMIPAMSGRLEITALNGRS